MSSGRKVLIVFGVLVVLLAGALGVALSVRETGVAVEAGSVTRQNLVRTVTANGEIKPKRYVNISSNTFGPIVRLAVSEGDAVEQGEFLAQIESIQTQADLQSAQASLDAAGSELEGIEASIRSAQASLASARADKARVESDLERSRMDNDRAAALFEEGLISTEEFERVQSAYTIALTQLDSADARIEQSEAQLAQVFQQREGLRFRIQQQDASLVRARDALDKTTIIAPLSGVITYLPVNEGENAIVGIQNQPGTTLMTIADMSVIVTEVRVDETDIVDLRLDQRTEIRVDALGERILTGYVSEIGNSALTASGAPASTSTTTSNNEARDFKVVITLDDPPGELRPGLSATATIQTASRDKALSVPLQAMTVREIAPSEVPSFIKNPVLIEQTGQDPVVEQEGVFVIENGHAVFRPVLTGIVGTTEIEILDGLEESDEIITGPYRVLRTLEDGAAVRIAESESET
jgi:HlyD family secretion protein